MMLIMCLSVFAGCSLVTQNQAAYFNSIVGTITYTTGEKDNITKQELITAYNSYGYNYVENYGMSQKEAFEETLETIFDNHLTMRAVEIYYEEHPEEGEMLNDNETTYLWDQTYEALYSNLKDYLLENLEIEDSEESSTEEEANVSVYKPYSPTAYYDSTTGRIIKYQSASTIRADYEARQNQSGVAVDYEYVDKQGNQIFKDEMYNKIYELIEDSDLTSSRNWRNAFTKYVNVIKSNYGYEKLTSNKEWFEYEMDRVYNIIKDNYIIEKYEVIYNRQSHQGANVSNITVNDILNLYSSKVRADYAKYYVSNDISGYESSMLSDVGSMDYIIKGENVGNYFYVGYVKVEFTKEQKARLTKLNEQLENRDIDQAAYDAEVDKLYSEVVAVERNASTGEKTKTTYDIDTLETKIKTELEKYRYITVDDLTEDQKAEAEAEGMTLEDYVAQENKTTENKKAEVFRKYLYLYNDDDSVKGTDYCTVFGVKGDEVFAQDAFLSGEDSSLSEEIKQAILGLYSVDAKIGDTTSFVRTSDGVYMFFYAGEIDNLFSGITADFNIAKNPGTINVLTSTRINIFSNKTIFDVLYDELATDNFAIFKNMDINRLRSELTLKIERIDNNMKDLY